MAAYALTPQITAGLARRSPLSAADPAHPLLEFYPFERQVDAASAPSSNHDHLSGAVSDGFRLALPRDVLIREADRDTRDLRKAPALCHFAPLIVSHNQAPLRIDTIEDGAKDQHSTLVMRICPEKEMSRPHYTRSSYRYF